MANSTQQRNPLGSGREKLIMVVLGREWRGGSDFYRAPDRCQRIENDAYVIISTPDNLTDKDMLDLIALSDSNPHVFLMEEGRNPQEDLKKWEKIFGEEIVQNMIYITDKQRTFDRNKSINKENIGPKCEQIYHKQICAKYNFTGFFNRRKIRTDQHQDRAGPGHQHHHRSSVHLVLLGESGSGKSTSGNTILDWTAFTSRPSSRPVTTRCKMQSKNVYGTEVKVIDTPDFFDDDLHMQTREVLECSKMTEGKVCVYLLVIQIGRFTEGERDILERLEKALQTNIRDRSIILFTRGEDLRSQPIDDYVKNTTPFLQELISQCGGRYQVFSNKDKKEAEKQLKELMGKIAELVEKTDGVKIIPEYDARSYSFLANRENCVIA